MTIPTDITYAQQLETEDPLAHFRERFIIPDPDLIYLDGNSLGRLPNTTAILAHDLIQRPWANRLIRRWNEGWIDAPSYIGGKMAQLIGAEPDELLVADSTSINLFKLVVAALRLQRGRKAILTDNLNFPSDIYILQGVIELLGQSHQLDIISSDDAIYRPVAGLLAAFNNCFGSSFAYCLQKWLLLRYGFSDGGRT